MIKWGRCNYRIKCVQRRKNGHKEIVNRQVNGYLCSVACAGYGGEILWPIGVHKEDSRWVLTDLISGLKVFDYAKRPEEPDVLKCASVIMGYWKQIEHEPCLGVEEAAKKAYRYLINDWEGLVGDTRNLEIRDFCYNPCFTDYPEFRCMNLRKGWMRDDNESVGEK